MSKSHKDLHDDYEAESSYQSSANQVRDEPLPASRHDDPRQEAVQRNEEHAGQGQEEGSRQGSRPPGQGEHPAQDEPGHGEG